MAGHETTVQRNFLLPIDQAEWLREHAFRVRRSQAQVVRDALAEYRARSEASLDDSGDHALALMERFRDGAGIDLELLRDKDDRIWSHDNP